MTAVLMTATRIVDTAFPGWLEVRLIDAHGREWAFVDKEPVFLSEPVDVGALPYEVPIDCEILAEDENLVRISTGQPWGIESEEGQTEFDVRRDQLAD